METQKEVQNDQKQNNIIIKNNGDNSDNIKHQQVDLDRLNKIKIMLQ